jgi:hypothetical protein
MGKFRHQFYPETIRLVKSRAILGRRSLALLVAAFAFLLLSLQRNLSFSVYDEGVMLVGEHTKDNEVIFSGLTRHDKIFSNDIMIYFVAKRGPVTKWHQFDPGLQTTATIQTEIVS